MKALMLHSHPRKIILPSITIHWMLILSARLLHSFAMFEVADENMFSFCLPLPLLSYTLFTISMEEGKVGFFSFSHWHLSCFDCSTWIQQIFHSKNVSESCAWQKRAQPFWDMRDPLPFSHKFTGWGCSSFQTCLLQLAKIPSPLVYIIPEKAVLLAD